MKIKTENYLQQKNTLPLQGQHIIAHQQQDQLVVYQAYNHHIADYAVANQRLGGSHYSYNRMSWIKPNFLWMMYRCGWASKENQERVLAIWIDKTDFEKILSEAVFSSYNPRYYSSHDVWKNELSKKDVRLQWDPDHDPYGVSVERRAVQIGMKGDVLKAFGSQQIKLIEDVTDFVREQKMHVDNRDLGKLVVPVERVYEVGDEDLKKVVGIDE